jgi:fructoselysine 6-kinase
MEMRLLAVGDNCIDDYSELGKRFPGGNALNVAVYANRVVGVSGSYVGVIGDDEGGDFILSQMKKEGLSTYGIIRLHGSTAVTKILVRDGERVFADYQEGVQKGVILPDSYIPRMRGNNLVHFTVWGLGREHIPELARERGPVLSCDFSNQLEHEALSVMPYLDYSFFSGKELIANGIDLEARLRELKTRTPGTVVMTLGEHGSLAFDGRMVYGGKALAVDVIDTLGAGDSYIAAFLCARLTGASIPGAIKAGHAAAKEICTRLGGWGGN